MSIRTTGASPPASVRTAGRSGRAARTAAVWPAVRSTASMSWPSTETRKAVWPWPAAPLRSNRGRIAGESPG